MGVIRAGTRVVQKYGDRLRGTVVRVHETFTGSHPGRAFKTLYDVRLTDPREYARVGGDMPGDAGWLRSTFRIETFRPSAQPLGK